ncbi:MAG: pentapeptide repeat-containing protein [Peptostreptococcaceae bacterium]|nr:pentapeptide repeat-containing protein [Peptostreptococcaceae bacterium]
MQFSAHAAGFNAIDEIGSTIYDAGVLNDSGDAYTCAAGRYFYGCIDNGLLGLRLGFFNTGFFNTGFFNTGFFNTGFLNTGFLDSRLCF